jgi:hypothetical protein
MAVARNFPRSVRRIAGTQRKCFSVAITMAGFDPRRLDRRVPRHGRVDIDVLQRREVDLIPIRGGFQLSPLMRPRKREAHPFGIQQIKRFLRLKRPLQNQRAAGRERSTDHHGKVA